MSHPRYAYVVVVLLRIAEYLASSLFPCDEVLASAETLAAITTPIDKAEVARSKAQRRQKTDDDDEDNEDDENSENSEEDDEDQEEEEPEPTPVKKGKVQAQDSADTVRDAMKVRLIFGFAARL